MIAERTYTAQRPGKCHVCGVHIRRGQPCAIAPFRHVGCPAWQPGELEALAAKLGKELPVDVSEPAAPANPFVTHIDRDYINKQLKDLTSELGRADAKCDGILRFNPDHMETTHYQCVNRRADLEGEIVYWRRQADEVIS